MSKRDCNRKGYLKGSVRSRIVCEKQLISIEKTTKDKKEIRKPQLGPRAIAWNEFRKTGKIDRAYEMIAEIYGENTFSNNVCQETVIRAQRIKYFCEFFITLEHS